MSNQKRPTEAPITDPVIAAYLNRVPEPLYKRFPSRPHRGRFQGEDSLRAHDRKL